MSDRAPLFHVTEDNSAPLLVALLNSFVVDFAARSSVGGTDLSYFIIKQLPIFPPEPFQEDTGWGCTFMEFIVPRVLELTYTSWDLGPFAEQLGYDGQPFQWEEDRRFTLKCEIDAALFHLYGMEYDDLDYIMDTFPIVKRDEQRSFGEYRTKRVILEIYNEMALARKIGSTYQTKLIQPPVELL